jgi:hypothetical protein
LPTWLRRRSLPAELESADRRAAGGAFPGRYLPTCDALANERGWSPPRVALAAVAAGAAMVLSADGSGELRGPARTAVASPQTRISPHRQSSTPSTPLPATASLQPAAIQTRAQELLTGYLALPHGRGPLRASRHVAARGLRRELQRNRPRVTPMQRRTRTRAVHLRAALCSPRSARAAATLKNRGGRPYPLQLYLERRGALWVVTHIGDA